MDVNPKIIKSMVERGQPVKLGDLVNHPKLFEHYPDLKSLTVRTADIGKGNIAHYDAHNNEIVFSKDTLNKAVVRNAALARALSSTEGKRQFVLSKLQKEKNTYTPEEYKQARQYYYDDPGAALS